MNAPELNLEAFYELIDKAIEQKATPEELQQIEKLVLTDAQARRIYAEYMHQNAVLRWHRGVGDAAENAAADTRSYRLRWVFRGMVRNIAALVAVALLGYVVLFWSARSSGEFATLLDARGARWEGGTLPTETGSRLAAGRLRLADGLATIRFDHGAQLTIEGPADFEIKHRDLCVLRMGGLTANIPPAAIGFTIDTPKARVVDQGTSFGVSVDASGEGRVQVFEGIVDVKHAAGGENQRLTTGKSVRVAQQQLQHVSESDDEGTVGPTGQAMLPAADSLRITTAQGRGRDGYIKHPSTNSHDSDVLLLVKNAKTGGFSRKAYMAFDITTLKSRTIRDARLQLTMLPTGWGFASALPDCDFEVYGLVDETRDGWHPQQIDWASAPANIDDGGKVDETKVRRIGSFRVPRGVQQGTIEVAGRELTELLNADTNGVVTLIVVRVTQELKAGNLVHGFASSRHPSAPPPTLRISVD